MRPRAPRFYSRPSSNDHTVPLGEPKSSQEVLDMRTLYCCIVNLRHSSLPDEDAVWLGIRGPEPQDIHHGEGRYERGHPEHLCPSAHMGADHISMLIGALARIMENFSVTSPRIKEDLDSIQRAAARIHAAVLPLVVDRDGD